ncbi:hypothetical protein INS49_004157 [Diaporthe citri]|uniref:uncharacterized protein n=1 Tax=Diaporthe citri TaxID=83186 RepID=UPI001C7F5EAB|nr:uncharacterized protein INS49_004157 [Diaporthe citri]KAG6355076.1 hypothetical protein INS49_004157 [Diaporthe citri]
MTVNMAYSEGITASTVALGAIAAIAIYLSAKVTYRLYLHPLSRFPGPRLAAATYLYGAYYDVVQEAQFVFKLDALHDTYGPVVRISPGEVHVRDSGFFDTLHPGPGGRKTHRDKWYRANRANGAPGSLASAEAHALHRARRAAVNPYFSRAAIAQLEAESIRAKVELLCERLREHASPSSAAAGGASAEGGGEVVDVGAAMTALTLDVISEYCYGDCYDCLRDPAFAPQWKRAMQGGFESTNVTKHFIWLLQLINSLPAWLAVKMNPDIAVFVEWKDRLRAQAKAIYAEQHQQQQAGLDKDGKGVWEKEEVEEKQNQPRPKTIFHGIMQADLPPAEKTADRLADEAFVLLVAGAETTARTLCVILCHLLSSPPVLARLRAELDPVMQQHQPQLPPSRVLEEIPLLRAVVQEGTRLAEPVTNRQILVAPEEDLVVSSSGNGGGGAIVIPRGTPVSQTFRDVLLDPEIFPEPRRFDPDRFARAAAEGNRLDRYLVSFSRGGRSCAGVNLAYAELYLTVAALVGRFDMELFDFDRARDLDVVRDKFIGMPSKEARSIRFRFRPRGS